MVDKRVPPPPGAPNPTVTPRYGEDALSYVLGTSSSTLSDAEIRNKVVDTLAAQGDGSIDLFELSRDIGVGFVALSRVLDDMAGADQVSVTGEPGNEQVTTRLK